MGTDVLLVDLTTEPPAGESGLAEVAQGMIGLSKVVAPLVLPDGQEVPFVRGGVAAGAAAVRWSWELADELANTDADRVVMAAHDPSDPASAVAVLSHVDGVVVAVAAGSRARDVRELIDRLTTIGLAPVGCVFVHSSDQGPIPRTLALRWPAFTSRAGAGSPRVTAAALL
jgi:hypothetical protein